MTLLGFVPSISYCLQSTWKSGVGMSIFPDIHHQGKVAGSQWLRDSSRKEYRCELLAVDTITWVSTPVYNSTF